MRTFMRIQKLCIVLPLAGALVACQERASDDPSTAQDLRVPGASSPTV